MDGQEQHIQLKSSFYEFLDRDYGQGSYVQKINAMADAGERRLIVDLNELRAEKPELARGLLEDAATYLPPFEAALDDQLRNQRPKYLQENQEVHIGFTGSFGFHRVSPRELLSPLLSKLVCLEGIVTKASLVRPKVVKSVHYCPKTEEFTSRMYRDVTSFATPTGSAYPTKDASGNLLQTEYGLSVYKDYQTIIVQEMPENSPAGQLPCSVEIVVEDDLVDLCKPGDRISITGVYKSIPQTAKGTTTGIFHTLIVATNVRQLAKEVQQPSFSQEDMKNIRKLVKRKDLFEVVADSLAPSIYGHDMIKKALTLQLLGGHEKNLANGAHLRGDVNVLMVGDPSVAKSQMIRAVMNVAPLAISTTGRGSSGVGLTAAVVNDQDSGERRLEAGAMVLADRGVVCIDEFDKMSDADRVAIHEVMEQQTVTIAKAGIHTSLNARCSVLAAANPIYGAYDHSKPIMFNIALPDSLLSRFDVVFVVLDQSNTETDQLISEHVLRMHRYQKPGEQTTLGPQEFVTAMVSDDTDEAAEVEDTPMWVKYNRLLHGKGKKRELLSTNFLKKYIHWCKFLKPPQLSDEAVDYISQQYAEMRREREEGNEKTLPVTARSLETMIRLSTAHAKLRQSKEVTLEDARKALGVMKYAIYADEKKAMDAATAAAARKAARGGADDETDEEQDDDGTDGATGAAQAEARSRRRTRRSTGEADPGEEEATDKAATEQGGNSDEALQRKRRRTALAAEEAAEAAEAATVSAAAPDAPTISEERKNAIMKRLGDAFTAERTEQMHMIAALEAINREAFEGGAFTNAELGAVLAMMESENKVMTEDGYINLI